MKYSDGVRVKIYVIFTFVVSHRDAMNKNRNIKTKWMFMYYNNPGWLWTIKIKDSQLIIYQNSNIDNSEKNLAWTKKKTPAWTKKKPLYEQRKKPGINKERFPLSRKVVPSVKWGRLQAALHSSLSDHKNHELRRNNCTLHTRSMLLYNLSL